MILAMITERKSLTDSVEKMGNQRGKKILTKRLNNLTV
jgi:hypothetical protein